MTTQAYNPVTKSFTVVDSSRVNLLAVEFTRPNDTTAYEVNDVISNSTSAPTLITYTNISSPSGYIVKARLFTNQVANTAFFRLHLFHTSITPINDNSPYTLLYANKASRICYLDFPACSTEGTGSDCAQAVWLGAALPFITSGNGTIYAALETKTAFTPAANQKFWIELSVDAG